MSLFFNVWVHTCVSMCVVCRDAKCGKIQCQGGANRPVIGTNAVSIETNIPLQEGGRILCRGTHVYLGDDMPDPGLVLAGTKCGDGMVGDHGASYDCNIQIWSMINQSITIQNQVSTIINNLTKYCKCVDIGCLLLKSAVISGLFILIMLPGDERDDDVIVWNLWVWGTLNSRPSRCCCLIEIKISTWARHIPCNIDIQVWRPRVHVTRVYSSW